MLSVLISGLFSVTVLVGALAFIVWHMAQAWPGIVLALNHDVPGHPQRKKIRSGGFRPVPAT